jgi:DNA polymerase-3 subunit alpha
MPDMDIDFDEDGRNLVLNYVIEKYGQKRVAQIVTFGSMAPKLAIKDVARVHKMHIDESNRLTKLVPERVGTNFQSAYKESPELAKERESSNPLVKETLLYAEKLEGSIRQTGVHACGVIIGQDDLENFIPISTAKDSNLSVVQFDKDQVEKVGLIKMDFLGLKTLSIVKDAVENVKISKGIEINIDEIPLDDEKTFKLYSSGETIGLFQFESPGMRKYLKELKPTRLEDLIAMNALYRPGPMDNIPKFIARKLGREEVVYDLPAMEEHLKETYGITVYQEQVMLLSQKLAGFSGGQADTLRKAMGKKQKDTLEKLKSAYLAGMRANGYPEKISEKIWDEWESFADYAFNKSHSTCYAYLSYQTAYLKANYQSEFMAALLSRNLSDIKSIGIFMNECKRLNIRVLGPDVNHSFVKFTVDKNENIRFGIAAIKGVGEGVVEEIVNERNNNGEYTDIYNFIERINLQTVNKKALEAMAGAGAFDSLGRFHRAQYFVSLENEEGTFVEKLIQYGNKYQADKSDKQNSLFGAGAANIEIKRPEAPNCQQFNTLSKLEKEKELIGMYLSAHPLDDYKMELKHYCTYQMKDFENLQRIRGREFRAGGMVTNVKTGQTREKNNPYGIITLEDYSGTHEFPLFGDDYKNFGVYLQLGLFLFIKGKVQERRYNESKLDIKINDMFPLGEVSKKQQINNIRIGIPLQELTEDLVSELSELTQEEQGNIIIHFNITDENNEKHRVKMFSRTKKATFSNKLSNFFEIHPKISLTFS